MPLGRKEGYTVAKVNYVKFQVRSLDHWLTSLYFLTVWCSYCCSIQATFIVFSVYKFCWVGHSRARHKEWDFTLVETSSFITSSVRWLECVFRHICAISSLFIFMNNFFPKVTVSKLSLVSEGIFQSLNYMHSSFNVGVPPEGGRGIEIGRSVSPPAGRTPA